VTETTEDAELKAIKTMLSVLSDLDKAACDRVLAYVFTRLSFKSPSQVLRETAGSLTPSAAAEVPSTGGRIKDIRTFTEEKRPRSANEMAALVAYFLQHEAGEGERKDAITKSDVEKYFHLAKFKMPRDGAFTLVNSKNAGYLDQRGKGHYALNPVGYNLVAHKLGTDRSGGAGAGQSRDSRKRNKKATGRK
jgi:hypothetical protein